MPFSSRATAAQTRVGSGTASTVSAVGAEQRAGGDVTRYSRHAMGRS